MAVARRGEDVAHRYLERELGFTVISRNYRHPVRRVEIDLVAVDGQTLVIVEVKTRTSDEISHPARAMDSTKMRHIGDAAREWIRKAEGLQMAVRFDLITVVTGPPMKIEYYRDAAGL